MAGNSTKPTSPCDESDGSVEVQGAWRSKVVLEFEVLEFRGRKRQRKIEKHIEKGLGV